MHQDVNINHNLTLHFIISTNLTTLSTNPIILVISVSIDWFYYVKFTNVLSCNPP